MKEMLLDSDYNPRVRVYKRNDRNGEYWITYYLPDGVRIRKRLSDKKQEAELLARKKEKELLLGNFSKKDCEKAPELLGLKKMTLEDAVEYYIRKTKLNKAFKTIETDRYSLNAAMRYFAKSFNRVYVSDIISEDIERYRDHRFKEGIKKVTANDYLKWLSKFFNKLEKDKIIIGNPCKEVERFRLSVAEKTRTVYFLPEDLAKLLNVEFDESKKVFPIKSLFLLMLNTGLRKGEALNLEWRDIDLKKRLIHIHHKPDCPTKDGMGWTPKWRKDRIVLLNDTASKILTELPRYNNVSGRINNSDTFYPADFVFVKKDVEIIDCKKKCYNCERNVRVKRSRLFCGHRIVRYLRCDSPHKSWKTFLKVAGVEANKYRLEDTRTTFNTFALSHAEFDRNMTCFMLGHDEDVNKKHYTNQDLLAQMYTQKIRERINNLPFNVVSINNLVK